MLETYIYSIISVIIVSLISVVVATPLLIKKKISNKVLLFLLSISVGVLLATVFFGLVPEMYAHHEDHEIHSEIGGVEQDHEEVMLGHDELNESGEHLEEHGYNELIIPGIYLLIGFLIMFIIEKFIHFHHSNKCEHVDHGHSHAYSIAPVNLIGDGVHNFIDGLIIAGAYVVSIPVGIAATISVIFHEVPQEIADFGVLLYSGLNKKKALIFNFLSAATAIMGSIVGLTLASMIEGFTMFMIPFAAGNFLYIASSNLLPQLHRHCGVKDTIYHILAIILGVVLVIGVGMVFPHSH